MLPKKTQDVLTQLREELADPKRRVIAFIGSGISRLPPANLPGWLGLAELVSKEIEEQYGSKSEQALSAQKYLRVLREIENDVDYLILTFRKLSELIGEANFQGIISRHLKVSDQDVPLILQRLVDLPFSGFITTNLDQLIEKAALKKAKGFDLVLKGPRAAAQRLARTTGWLWKIHGCVLEPSNWVFSTESYVRTRSKEHPYFQHLSLLAQSSRFVFFGFGGKDPNISWLMEQLRDAYGARDDPHVIIARNPEDIDCGILKALVEPVYFEESDFEVGLDSVVSALSTSSYLPKGYLVRTDFSSLRAKLLPVLSGIRHPDFVGELFGVRRASDIAQVEAELEIYEDTGLLGQYEISPNRTRNDDLHRSTSFVIKGGVLSGRTALLVNIFQHWKLSHDDRYILFIDSTTIIRGRDRRYESLDEILTAWLDTVASVCEDDGTHIIAAKERLGVIIDDLDLLVGVGNVSAFLKEEVDLAIGRGMLFGASVVDMDTKYVGQTPVYHLYGLSEEGIRYFIKTWTERVQDKVDLAHVPLTDLALSELILGDSALFELARLPGVLGNLLGYALVEGASQLSLHNLSSDVVGRFVGRLRRASGLSNSCTTQLLCFLAWSITVALASDGRVLRAKNLAEQARGSIQELEEFPEEMLVRLIGFSGLVRVANGSELWVLNTPVTTLFAAEYCLGAIRTNERPAHLIFLLAQACAFDVLDWLPVALNVSDGSGFGLAQHLIEGVDLFSDEYRVEAALLLSRLHLHRSSNLSSAMIVLRERISKLSRSYSGSRERLLLAVDEIDSFFGQSSGSTRFTWVLLRPRPFEWPPICDRFVAKVWDGTWVPTPIDAFEILDAPVTVAQYAMFMKEGGYSDESWWCAEGIEWKKMRELIAPSAWARQTSRPNCPVVGISWYEACAYIRWFGKRNDSAYQYALPSEAQYQFAASEHLATSKSSALFPWGANVPQEGSEAEINWAGARILRPTPVRSFPLSMSPSGVHDLYGNVEEWCLDLWVRPPGYSPPVELSEEVQSFRVVKGGSAIRTWIMCASPYRSRAIAYNRYPTIGFRIVRLRTDRLR